MLRLTDISLTVSLTNAAAIMSSSEGSALSDISEISSESPVSIHAHESSLSDDHVDSLGGSSNISSGDSEVDDDDFQDANSDLSDFSDMELEDDEVFSWKRIESRSF